MDRLKVRVAVDNDVLAIAAIVVDYFGRRKAPPQWRQGGTWYVAEFDGQICAAQNWSDILNGERWLQDTYCFETRAGRLCLGALMRFTHAQADHEGVALLGISEPDNLRVGHALNVAGWIDIGIVRRREPGAQRQKRSA